MADQGLPLMALPQQNLFGAAGDDLAHQLASREIAKRKQMLEDIDTQLKIQKGNSEADLAHNTVQTGVQTRQFAAQEQPMKLQKLGDEHTTAQDQHTSAADAHLKSIATQELNTKLRGAMDALDAATTPEARVIAGAHIKAYGGSLMTSEEAKALNAPTNDAAMEKLILAYANSTGPEKEANGMRLAHLGLPAGALSPPKQYQFLDNGAAVGDLNAGTVSPTGFKPVSTAAAQYSQDTIDHIADEVFKQNRGITTVAAAARPGVEEALAKRGASIPALSMQSKFMRETADALLPMIDHVGELAKQVDQAGLMGTFGGILAKKAAGISAVADLAGLTPEQRTLLGDFESEAGALNVSGIARAHGGVRAGASPAMIERLEQAFGPGMKDLPTFLGNMRGAKAWMTNYSQMGQSTENNPVGGGAAGAPSGGISVSRDANGNLVVKR